MLSAFLLSLLPLWKRGSVPPLPCGGHQPVLGGLPLCALHTQYIPSTVQGFPVQRPSRIPSRAFLKGSCPDGPPCSPRLPIEPPPAPLVSSCSLRPHPQQGKPGLGRGGCPAIPGHKVRQPLILPARQGTPSSGLPACHLLACLPAKILTGHHQSPPLLPVIFPFLPNPAAGGIQTHMSPSCRDSTLQ